MFNGRAKPIRISGILLHNRVFMDISWVRILLLDKGMYVNGTEQKKCPVFYGMRVRICKKLL